MPLNMPTQDHLHRTGSLKWSGMAAPDGRPTIGAWVAEMDFGTAPVVEEAICRALHDGLTGYRPSWLLPRVQEATSAFQASAFGWAVDPDHVRMSGAVLPALVTTIRKLTRPGSAVVVPTPAYMPFLTLPGMLDRRVIDVPSLHGVAAGGVGWRLDLEGIDRALEGGAGLVILCNPWNPTGRILSEEELRGLHEVVQRHDALVFSDEIHSPIVLDDSPFISYARIGEEFAAHTITATAATKAWNIAGLPNAQVIVPDAALRARWDAATHLFDHQPVTLGALGTIAAYEGGGPWLEEVMEVVRGNVDLVERALDGSGIDFIRPQGTYLAWWGFGATPLAGSNPSEQILRRAHVATNDGAALGEAYGDWARVNLACSPSTAEEIVERILRLLP